MDGVFWLAHRLAVLPEASMRQAVLLEELESASPERVVLALAQLQDGATRHRSPEYLVASDALAAAIGRLPYVVRRDLYEAAKTAGLDGVARLFFSSAGHDGEPNPPEPEQYVPAAGRTVTLGERKNLARRGRRDIVSALLRDPDAGVIANVLANPRLTERDVLAVAARRPARGDVLRAIFASKWVCRYHVKRALVLNPYTPDEIGVRLVGALCETDLRFVAADAQLGLPVRAQARSLLARL